MVELGVGVHLRLSGRGIDVAIFLDVQLDAVFGAVLGENGDDGGRSEHRDKTENLHVDRGRWGRGLFCAVVACKNPEATVWNVEAVVGTDAALKRCVPGLDLASSESEGEHSAGLVNRPS